MIVLKEDKTYWQFVLIVVGDLAHFFYMILVLMPVENPKAMLKTPSTHTKATVVEGIEPHYSPSHGNLATLHIVLPGDLLLILFF